MANRFVPTEAYPNEIILEIEGLRQLADGTFALVGVKSIDIPYEEIEKLLTDVGVPMPIARTHTEDFCESIGRALIADAIAQRCKRVC